MYIGRYYHALEQKGRLSIPISFRKLLGKNIFITSGLDGCLFLYSEIEWHKVITGVELLPLTKKHARDWIRLLTNNANQDAFDSLGRIHIPEHLREKAHLIKEVVIVGTLNRVEIWDQKEYHLYLDSIESNAENIAESIEN